ncbi:MAG: FecR family protein [Ginsengibacter sp.]
MGTSRLEDLFDLYVNDNYTLEEEAELMALLKEDENQEKLKSLIGNLIKDTGPEIHLNHERAKAVFDNILLKGNLIEKENLRNVVSMKQKLAIYHFWFRVAAILILFIGGLTMYLWLRNSSGSFKAVSIADRQSKVVLPDANNAILRISDGTSFVLDSMKDGMSLKRGKTTITKEGNEIIYSVSSLNGGNEIVYSTLTTPHADQYQVVLPDGSKVWLNGSSSIYFPSQFESQKREVKITGEAYFEVSKNKNKPFFVEVGKMAVRVLGTHFNINAYGNEGAIKTSLLEGSVKVIETNKTQLLKPGEQAVWNEKEDKITVNHPNMDEVIAWKNGLFEFHDDDIQAIMREISRWYNVRVKYEGEIPSKKYEGKISRNAKLSEVLKILELSDVKFTLRNNEIIVH